MTQDDRIRLMRTYFRDHIEAVKSQIEAVKSSSEGVEEVSLEMIAEVELRIIKTEEMALVSRLCSGTSIIAVSLLFVANLEEVRQLSSMVSKVVTMELACADNLHNATTIEQAKSITLQTIDTLIPIASDLKKLCAGLGDTDPRYSTGV